MRLIAIDVHGNVEYDVYMELPGLPQSNTYSYEFFHQSSSHRTIGPWFKMIFANEGNTVYIIGNRNKSNRYTIQADGYYIKKVNLHEDGYQIEWIVDEDFQEGRRGANHIFGNIRHYFDEEEGVLLYAYNAVQMGQSNYFGYEVLTSSGERLFEIGRQDPILETRRARFQSNVVSGVHFNIWTRTLYYFLSHFTNENPSQPWLKRHHEIIKENARRGTISETVNVSFMFKGDYVYLLKENTSDNTLKVYRTARS